MKRHTLNAFVIHTLSVQPAVCFHIFIGKMCSCKFLCARRQQHMKHVYLLDDSLEICLFLESSDASRRESMASRSMSEWNWSDTRSDDKVSPSTCSINSSVFKVGRFHLPSVSSDKSRFFLSRVPQTNTSPLTTPWE